MRAQIGGVILFAAGAVLASGQSRDNPAWNVLQRRLERYANGHGVRAQHKFITLPPGAVGARGWLRDWAADALNGITGHLDEYSNTYGEAWKGHAFEARGVQPDGTGWPLEQCSYWLDGAVRLAWIMQDKALMEKVRHRLDTVVAGVREGGATLIYWRPKSAVEEHLQQLGALAHGPRTGRLLSRHRRSQGA